jgi:hypothetical protein
MHVCIYMYIYILYYAYTFVCMYVYICRYFRMYVYMCIYADNFWLLLPHGGICIHAYMHTYMKWRRIHTYTHTCIHTYIMLQSVANVSIGATLNCRHIHTHIHPYMQIGTTNIPIGAIVNCRHINTTYIHTCRLAPRTSQLVPS